MPLTSSLVHLTSAAPPLVGAPANGPLVDTFGRTHDNLRISVTDRCNIRCFYCMPEDAADFVAQSRQLTFDEIERFVKVSQKLGVRKVRLTGGEPLLRKNVAELVQRLSACGLDELALTTNAVLLSRFAKPLYDAGLRRLNIHLDSLDRERFRQITRRDELDRVLAGIDAAIEAGFRSIKLNAVAIRDLNEPDILPLAHFARNRNLELRYIEFMPLDSQGLWSRGRVLLADEIIGMLTAEFGTLRAAPNRDPRAPATEYEYSDGAGSVGVIASVSHPFCDTCNRLRLTADGKLRYCLFAREETPVSHLLRPGSEPDLESTMRATVWRKWRGHEIDAQSFAAPDRPMYAIGG